LAVKIVRQPKNIALLGAPTSAASLTAGHEQAPRALRAAGLVARLAAAGFTVTDYGDCTARTFQPDDEHPRARNVTQVLAALEELRPKVEIAVKSGALPVILGGDDSVVLATIAGARRYYRNVSLIYLDRDAALNVPATTPSGCVDGMVISHVIGRGAPELVRFWGEPPLVREPDVAIFGVERLDEPEQQFLGRSSLRRFLAEDIARKQPAASAERALESVHARGHEFVLHIDLDVIAGEDFRAANLSAPGGLRLDDVREALSVFARQATLAALVISAYNPNLDADGAAAKQVIDLLVEILSPRFQENAAQSAPAAGIDETSVTSPAVADASVGAVEPATPPESESSTGSEAPEAPPRADSSEN
jgi:arginase